MCVPQILYTSFNRPVASLRRNEIHVRSVITGMRFNVEEARTKLVLKTLTAQQYGVDSRLSAILELLIKHFVRELMRSPRTIIVVTKAFIDNPGFIAPTAAIVKS